MRNFDKLLTWRCGGPADRKVTPITTGNWVGLEPLEPRLLLSASGEADVVAALGGAGDDVPGYTAWWKFDETAGSTAHDESPNAFDGTVSGASWTGGHDGNALSFDNLDDYVDLDTNGLIGELTSHAQGSVSLWFKIDTLPTGGAVHSIFYIGDGGGSGTDSFHIEVGHFNDSQQQELYFTLIKDGHVAMCYDSGGFELIETDTWYHFVGIVGADYNTGYLNGREMIGRSYNVGTTASDHYWFANLETPTICLAGKGILGSQSNWKYFDGIIDEVRIYDRPLAALEVTLLYGTAPPVGTEYEFTSEPGDGTVLGNGTVNTSSGYFVVGDWTDNSEARAVMHFDTSTLRANAYILDAELILTRQQPVNGDPYGDLAGGMTLDIKVPYFGTAQTVQADDYDAAPDQADAAAGPIVLGPVGENMTIPIAGAALTAIGGGETTQIRLQFPAETDGDSSYDREFISSGDSITSAYRPRLIVRVAIPGDVSLNGYVDDDDLSLLLANWHIGDEWSEGDLDDNGSVDDDDLSILLTNWHGGIPPAPAGAPTEFAVGGTNENSSPRNSPEATVPLTNLPDCPPARTEHDHTPSPIPQGADRVDESPRLGLQELQASSCYPLATLPVRSVRDPRAPSAPGGRPARQSAGSGDLRIASLDGEPPDILRLTLKTPL